MKFSVRDLLFVVTMVCLAGCRVDIEKELGLHYAPPTVPPDVSEHHVPAPQSRDENWLRPGETSINVKEMYLAGYRQGWETAIEHWRRTKNFKYKTKEDAMEDTFTPVNDAIWLGYCKAKRQIEEQTGKP